MPQSIQQLLNYVNQNPSLFPNYEIAEKVLEGLIYYSENSEEIEEKIKNKDFNSERDAKLGVLRVPPSENNLAFHVLDYLGNSTRNFTSDSQRYIKDLETSIDYLFSLNNPAYINHFVKLIRDSELGCMEARLAPAKRFAELTHLNGGAMSLNDLMMNFFGKLSENNVDQSSAWEVMTLALAEFNDLLLTSFLVSIPPDNILKPLAPIDIKNYLVDTMQYDDFEFKDLMNATSFKKPIRIEEVKYKGKEWIKFSFENENDAKTNFIFIMGILNQNIKVYSFDDSEINYDEKTSTFYFNWDLRQYDLFAKVITGTPIHTIPSKGMGIKSIRADKDCYFRQFAAGVVFATPDRKAPKNRNTKLRKTYTVKHQGVFKRDEKPPHYTAQQKEGFSQLQSISFVSPEYQPPVFSFSSDPKAPLVGVRLNMDQVLIGRIFDYEKGTIGYPYDFDSYEDALNFHENYTHAENPKLYQSLNELERRGNRRNLRTFKVNYNEVLARIRWRPQSTHEICIFNNELESKIVAQEVTITTWSRSKPKSYKFYY